MSSDCNHECHLVEQTEDAEISELSPADCHVLTETDYTGTYMARKEEIIGLPIRNG